MNTNVKSSVSEVVMTELVLPTHTNSFSSVFGGQIMSWIDIAGAISAQRHSKCEVVTASIDALNFEAPVYTGWVVNLKAKVNYVGKTSMEVGVRVDAENPRTGEKFKTAKAYLTFVAVDKNGKARPVPGLTPETPEDERRLREGKIRKEHRMALIKKQQD